ncbi:hypothetical protein LTR49_021907 [Elasticomyces elasticus]|nr:hypothetical protein LTR49_021907 [Elasticomyces elasticus]
MPSEGLSKKDYDYYSALYGDSDRQGRATTREDRYSEGRTSSRSQTPTMGDQQRKSSRIPKLKEDGSGTRTLRPEDFQGHYERRRAAFIEGRPRKESPTHIHRHGSKQDPFTLLDTQSATSNPPYGSSYGSNPDAGPGRGGSSSRYPQGTGYPGSSSSAYGSRR